MGSISVDIEWEVVGNCNQTQVGQSAQQLQLDRNGHLISRRCLDDVFFSLWMKEVYSLRHFHRLSRLYNTFNFQPVVLVQIPVCLNGSSPLRVTQPLIMWTTKEVLRTSSKP